MAAKLTVESVLADFPTPVLPRIIGEPNRQQIIEIHKLLCDNATAVGPGQFGFLALTLNAVDYNNVTNQAFVPPVDPGPMPPPVTPLMNSQESALQMEMYKIQKAQFQLFQTTGKALQK